MVARDCFLERSSDFASSLWGMTWTWTVSEMRPQPTHFFSDKLFILRKRRRRRRRWWWWWWWWWRWWCWEEELFPSPVSAVCMGLQVCSKGCVAAHFDHHGLPLCIANAHLEAGQGKVAKLLVYELRESRFHHTSVEWKGQQATLLVPKSTSQIRSRRGMANHMPEAWRWNMVKLTGFMDCSTFPDLSMLPRPAMKCLSVPQCLPRCPRNMGGIGTGAQSMNGVLWPVW